ncbi:MAG: lipase family protein [Proteobacteria bacterium]|nr:lipase family protein [Pseudomonadota bacterium]
MSMIVEYYKQSELAFAAYSNLTAGMSGKDYTDALQDGNKGLSVTQATEFAKKWSVVDQFTGSTGVSATVFKDNETGKTYLAVRGTESLGDYIADYILATGFPSNLNPQFFQLQGQVGQWLAEGKLTTGFTVAGHSLGGYLAAAIRSQFSADATNIYTFNAPGLGGGYGNIFDAFRTAFGLSDTALVDRIINIRGTAGISLVSYNCGVGPNQLTGIMQ